jgi:hypothetical protein
MKPAVDFLDRSIRARESGGRKLGHGTVGEQETTLPRQLNENLGLDT